MMRTGPVLAAFLALARLAHSGAADEERPGKAAPQTVELRPAEAGLADMVALWETQRHIVLNEEGYGETDFPTPTGKLLIRRAGDRIVADANGDGRIDEADGEGVPAQAAGPGRTTPEALKVSANVAGRKAQYPLMVLYARGRHVLLAGGAVLVGKFGDLELRLFDADLDGVFGETGTDTILVRSAEEGPGAASPPAGPGASANVMGLVLNLGGELYAVRTLDGGRALRIAPYDGEKASLELAAGGTATSLSLSLAHEEDACHLQVGSGVKVSLVPGAYRVTRSLLVLKLPQEKKKEESFFGRLLGGLTGQGEETGTLLGTEGEDPVLLTIRPGENRLPVGPPLRLEFTAKAWETHNDRLEIEDPVLVGGAGERYVADLHTRGRAGSSLKGLLRSGGEETLLGELEYG